MGSHLRLFAPWTTRLFSQQMLHWWQGNGSTRLNLFFAPTLQRRARGWSVGLAASTV